jgi:5-methylcytosine-specific restriction endonuclease McrA
VQETEEPERRGKSAQEELTDFFSEASSLATRKQPKIPVKGSLESFFKKMAQTPSDKLQSSTKRARNQQTPSASKEQGMEVTCDVCTFVNEVPVSSKEWLACQACANLIKVTAAASSSSKRQCSSEKKSSLRKSLDSTSVDQFTWSCKICTLSNSKPRSGSAWYTCDACAEPYVSPASSESSDAELDELLQTPALDRKQPPSMATAVSTGNSTPQWRPSRMSPEVIVLDIPDSRPSLDCSEVIEIDASPPPSPLMKKTKSSCHRPSLDCSGVIEIDASPPPTPFTKTAKSSSPEVIVLDDDSDDDATKQSIPSQKVSTPTHLIEFSISQHSGRITIHYASNGESSLVNFDVDEVVSNNTADLLLDARIKKVSVAGQQVQLEFDPERVQAILQKIASCGPQLPIHALADELKEFVTNYLRLRAIESKTLRESGKPFPARGLSQAVAKLLVSSFNGTERYIGGAKERARENVASGTASASDLSILDGRSCAWCGKCLSAACVRAKSTYCSQDCAEEGRLRRGGKFASVQIRAAAFALEGGKCTLCGLDAHALFEQIRSLQPPERLNKLLSTDWTLPKSSKALQTLLTDPKEGNFWQVDHIRAVAEGGGGCGMDNLRTLCVPCHTRETAKLHGRLPLQGPMNTQDGESSGQVDIRTIFASASKRSGTSREKKTDQLQRGHR